MNSKFINTSREIADRDRDRQNLISLIRPESSEQSLVLTASRRQSRYYTSILSDHLAGFNNVWQVPEVYSLEDWITGSSDLVLDELGERLLWQQSLDTLLQSSQWEEVSVAANINTMCRLAIEAATICDLWNIDYDRAEFNENDNSKFFAHWYKAFQQLCHKIGCRSRTQQILHIIDMPPAHLPRRIVIAGFIELAPAHYRLIASLRQSGRQVINYQRQAAQPRLHSYSFQESDDELKWIAEHCHEWHQKTGGQGGELGMAIIVPDLELRWQQVFAAFNHAFYGGASGSNFANQNRAFNLSGGIALIDMPLIDCAWKVLNLNPESPLTDLALLLQTPILQLGINRDQYRIMEQLLSRGYRKSLYQACQQFPGWRWLQQFADRDYWSQHDYPSRQVDKIYNRLAQTHWLESRQLNSSEYQQHQQWILQLRLVSSLDRLDRKISMQQTLGLLHAALDGLFQPKVNESRIQILGLYEALGLHFDRLWICGFTDQILPVAPSLSTFIPPSLLQQCTNMVYGGPQASFSHSKKIWQELLAIAPDITTSYGRTTEGDRENIVSPFVDHVADTLISRQPISLAQPEADTCISEQLSTPDSDAYYPSSLLEDQSACPFRAAIRHRIQAQSSNAENYYNHLDAGIIIHSILEQLLTDKQSSDADITTASESLIGRQIAERFPLHPWLGDSQAARQIAKQLAWQIDSWIEKERAGRTDIQIAATEEKYQCTIGSLNFSFRIDRVDRAGCGGIILVDYKTGSNIRTGDWEGTRPAGPQLLAYALAVGEQKVSGISFISLKLGQPGYLIYADKQIQYSFTDTGLIKSKEWFDSRLWRQWLGEQTKEVIKLAEEFAGGTVILAPKDHKVCKYCDYKPICRINQVRAIQYMD